MKNSWTGVVINNDEKEYQDFLQRRQRVIAEKQLSDRIDTLEKEMAKIKNILREISNRLS